MTRAPCALSRSAGQGPRGRAGAAQPRRGAGTRRDHPAAAAPPRGRLSWARKYSPARAGAAGSGVASPALPARPAVAVSTYLLPVQGGSYRGLFVCELVYLTLISIWHSPLSHYAITRFKTGLIIERLLSKQILPPWCFQTFLHNLPGSITAPRTRWQSLVRLPPSLIPYICFTRYLRFSRFCAKGKKKSVPAN